MSLLCFGYKWPQSLLSRWFGHQSSQPLGKEMFRSERFWLISRLIHWWLHHLMAWLRDGKNYDMEPGWDKWVTGVWAVLKGISMPTASFSDFVSLSLSFLAAMRQTALLHQAHPEASNIATPYHAASSNALFHHSNEWKNYGLHNILSQQWWVTGKRPDVCCVHSGTGTRLHSFWALTLTTWIILG